MTMTRGELKTKVLTLINKNSGYQGFITDEKINDAIEDTLDYIATIMFEEGEGWFNALETLTPSSGSFTVALSGLTHQPIMINAVRYLINNLYVDLEYDSQLRKTLVKDATELIQYPRTWRIIDGNLLYFNPAPSIVGSDYIQVEYAHLPDRISSDATVINTQFSYSLLQFAKWRTASICMTTAGRPVAEWKEYEAQWYDRMKAEVSKRSKQPTMIRDFDGV